VLPSIRERLAAVLDPQNKRALTANDAIRGLWAGTQTSTGLRVDEKTSLQVIAVFTAIKILSEGFSQIPLKVYRRSGDQRDELRTHPIYSLLHDAPNEHMTAFAMREHWMMALGLWGNSCTEIIRNNRGEVESLWPLHPAYTTKERLPDGRIIFRTKVNSDPRGYSASLEEKVLLEDQVLHIPGFSLDGFWGLSPIQQIRENIAMADAYQQFAAKFFANDAMDFALFTDKNMQQPQLDELHKEWSERHGGLNKHRLAIFHGGLRPEKIGMPMDDAQFIEQRKFTREEIMGFYRIPPHLYGDTEKSTSWGTGIEEMSNGFIKFTLDPWFVRTEQSLNLKFLSENAQGPLYAEFDREGFLRGDFDSRLNGYQKLFNLGSISNVRIAQLENLPRPPVEIFLVPSNMTPVDKIDAIADKAATPTPIPVVQAPAADNIAARMSLILAQRPVLLDVADRIVRRASFDIEKQREKRTPEDFETWLGDFRSEHLEFTKKHLRSVMDGFAEAVRGDVARETGLQIATFPNFTGSVLERMASVIASADDAEAVVDAELVEVGNAFAKMAYIGAGASCQTVSRGGYDVLISRVDGPVYESRQEMTRPDPQIIVVPSAPMPQPEVRVVTVATEPEFQRVLEEARELKDSDIERLAKMQRDAIREMFVEMRAAMPEPAPREPAQPIEVKLVFPENAFNVTVNPAPVTIDRGAVQVDNHVNMPEQGSGGMVIEYDAQGRLSGTRRRLGN
jgi:HK97 family phage portal protein